MKNKIREKRQERGMTLRNLAKAAGVSTAFISFVERNLRTPRLEVALKIARALDCQVEDLFVD